MANATTPKRTRKGGYRGLQHRTIENITKMWATLKAEPGISLQATAAILGWEWPKAWAVWQLIRRDYKKVWVHKDDYPDFFKVK